MKKWLTFGVLLVVALSFLGCAGAQVRPGDRLTVVYTGDTWGTLVPSG